MEMGGSEGEGRNGKDEDVGEMWGAYVKGRGGQKREFRGSVVGGGRSRRGIRGGREVNRRVEEEEVEIVLWWSCTLSYSENHDSASSDSDLIKKGPVKD
jgi:hypothetical protein